MEWSQRVKVMQRLIHGHMGMDVEYAMTPQFELRSYLDDIPAEFVKDSNAVRLSGPGDGIAFLKEDPSISLRWSCSYKTVGHRTHRSSP